MTYISKFHTSEFQRDAHMYLFHCSFEVFKPGPWQLNRWMAERWGAQGAPVLPPCYTIPTSWALSSSDVQGTCQHTIRCLVNAAEWMNEWMRVNEPSKSRFPFSFLLLRFFSPVPFGSWSVGTKKNRKILPLLMWDTVPLLPGAPLPHPHCALFCPEEDGGRGGTEGEP